ncbi:hypothetical protein PVNG_06288 [Plasmodium vivax North Korean]|uniref:Uncharacterized protein n=1 Tax=Plasmodium vivax North Korean TaxID=1035514 RepID=A0A0J9TL80_PLAVI|nr:hypothetical protein PVNG_06288 [Plasmodium vivax North Korean]
MLGSRNTELNENDVRNFSIAHGLYTGKFYDDLDKSTSFSSYNKYCGSANEPMHGNSLVRIVCATILKYLETKYSKLDHTSDTYDVCKLLNYWVYKRLNTILKSKGSIYINQVHGDIILKWNSFNDDVLRKPENYTCKPIDSIVIYDDWEKRKELYEYYVDYHQIKHYLQFDQKCKEFYNYIESKKKLYEHFESLCPNNNTNICPKFYNDCKKYNPKYVLQDVSCRNEIMQESAASAPSVSQSIKGHSVNESDSDEEYVGMKPFNAPPSNENSNNVRMYGNVLLGVVATSMTSGALYRVNINSLIQINCISLLISFIISP